LNVLVVEDEPAIRRLVFSILRDHGHAVLTAGSASDAVAEFGGFDGRFDVLVTDIALNGDDGVALALELRVRQPDLAVVFMSGLHESPNANRTPEGAVFLAKPFGPRELLARLASAVSESAAS
jgi:DNA-binding response OmpR family regulator